MKPLLLSLLLLAQSGSTQDSPPVRQINLPAEGGTITFQVLATESCDFTVYASQIGVFTNGVLFTTFYPAPPQTVRLIQ